MDEKRTVTKFGGFLGLYMYIFFLFFPTNKRQMHDLHADIYLSVPYSLVLGEAKIASERKGWELNANICF